MRFTVGFIHKTSRNYFNYASISLATAPKLDWLCREESKPSIVNVACRIYWAAISEYVSSSAFLCFPSMISKLGTLHVNWSSTAGFEAVQVRQSLLDQARLSIRPGEDFQLKSQLEIFWVFGHSDSGFGIAEWSNRGWSNRAIPSWKLISSNFKKKF